MKATPDRSPMNKGVQPQRSPGEGESSGGNLWNLWEQGRTRTETTGSRSVQQQDPPGEKERGGDKEEKNPERDKREVRGTILDYGAAGELALTEGYNSLLLALLLGSFLAGLWANGWHC